MVTSLCARRDRAAVDRDVEGDQAIRPTYFEAVTAAAFRWFADIAVDVAVIEVGMLGRWDATNIVDAQVAVITNIGLDHTEFAGPSLSDIAREKAGIIKPGQRGRGGGDRSGVGRHLPRRRRRQLPRSGQDFDTQDNELAVGGRRWRCARRRRSTPTFRPLHGAHQGDNAAVALTAVEAFFAAPLAEDSSHEGFADVVMPGRFEVIGCKPLVVIDGAHNLAGADACAQVFFDDFNPDGRRILVLGTLRSRPRCWRRCAPTSSTPWSPAPPRRRGHPGADVGRAAVGSGPEV